RRRHTRFKCDWSSDVCSSDLYQPVLEGDALEPIKRTYASLAAAIKSRQYLRSGAHVVPIEAFHTIALPLPDAEYWRARQRTKAEIGRASCRERGKSWVDGADT